MQLKRRSSVVGAMLFALVGVASCGGGGGDGGGGPSTPTPVLTTVNVSLASSTLQPGQTTTASAAGVDQNGGAIATGTVTWSSSVTSVASVSGSGAVTALAPGNTQITATAGGRTGSATLTVNPAPVATVTLTPATASLIVGATQQFAAATLDATGAVLAGRVVTWTSSDPTRVSIATSGLATAVSAGTATITATSEGRSATATVTVAPVPVASVTVTPATAAMLTGGTQQFTVATLDAAGAPLTGRTIAWSSSDVSKVTVSTSGLATAVAVGTATITATSEGKSASAAITVTAPPVPVCNQLRPITVGQSLNSSLTTSDCKLSDGTYVQKFDLQLTAQTAVQIDMSSSTIDSYLLLQNATTGAVVDENDDDGGQQNARITRLLPAGRYIIYANTFGAGVVGAYSLSVQAGSTACFTATPIGTSATATGTLRTSSCKLRDGSYAERYELNVTTRSTLRITMSSVIFDTWLIVQSDAGATIGEDDDGGGGTNSRLVLTLDPGRYFILANSYDPAVTGNFALEVLPVPSPCTVSRTLVNGVAITGTFATSDCVLTGGYLMQRFAVTLAQTTQLRIEMTSTAVDAYLVLQDANTGEIVLEDDNSGGGTNARLTGAIPAGQYVVNAISSTPGVVGSYQISMGTPPITQIVVSLNPATAALQPGQTQNITATVTGAANPAVTWVSSSPTVATVSTTGQVRAIAPGTATIRATSVEDPIKSAASVVTVSAGAPGALNLDIAAAYFTQAVQTIDGKLPLVANRRALLRVFVRTSQAGVTSIPVRARFYDGATLVSTVTANSTPTTAIDEGACCAAEFLLTDAQVKAGLRFVADVDPSNTVTETNETDNSYPLNGTPQAVTVQAVPDLRVVLVPVRFNKNGRTGQVASTLTSHLQKVWPIATLISTTAGTFSTDLAPLVGDDRNGSWSELLRQMESKRQLDGSTAYYFGVLKVDYTSGITGLAYIAGHAGIGVDVTFGAGTPYHSENLAHEMGHSFGRTHTPCFTGNNRPANPDPQYPFTDGRIGSYGVDLFGTTIVRYAPTAPDIMGYCDGGWASPYSWSAVSVYRASGANRLVTPARSALVISGMIQNGAIRVEPAFSAVIPTTPADPNGAFIVEARDDAGRVLASQRFSPLPVDHVDANTRPFSIAMPLDIDQQQNVASLTVRDANGARSSVQRARSTARASVRVDKFETISARTINASETEVTWLRDAIAAVAVRDRRTGQILAFSSEGALRIATDRMGDVELLLSDGVGSVVQQGAQIRKTP